MRILQVIHGYPMRYNAGSEVYTQTLCHGLAARHEVHVFTREEDPFAPDYRLRKEADPEDDRITLHVVNNPRHKDRYRAEGIDRRFAEVLDRVRPDVVHIGHLNHLSTSLVQEAAWRSLPIVHTLHDYWLMCPRGQFMQMYPEDVRDTWAPCNGQDDGKCAARCYARYFGGAPPDRATDIEYWTGWVARRMQHVREVSELVDHFVAPSRYLMDRFRREFGVPEHKLTYLDYGFDLRRLAGRLRAEGEPFTFGYIGTHIPAKGIQVLLRAFAGLAGKPRLRIWGRPRSQNTAALRSLCGRLDAEAGARVEWLSEYPNQDIVRDVFDRVDAIVVPSVWVENSPLVIHEAQQARVPVVTADAGGMAEYVRHGVNGLLFEHRSPSALAERMQELVDDPARARRLGQRGYLYSDNGDVPDMEGHVAEVERLYARVLEARGAAAAEPGPWRITFDTNPDTCNMRCVMCEEHSPHSTRQKMRRAAGLPRREMPVDLIRRVVAEAAGHGLQEIIPSTMGEPLLYEDFEEILDVCTRHGVLLNLTTNGTFPRLGPRRWAEKLVPLTSDVKISWNGATKTTHEAIMHGSRWEHALEAVQTFIAVRDEHASSGGNRCRVTFQVTFMDANVAELADIVRLAARLGVDRVKGHHLWAHFPELEAQSMRRSVDSIRRWNHAVQAASRAASEHLLPSGEEVLLENMFPLGEDATEDLAPGGACPFLGREAWVSARGRFNPCCAPDADRRKLGEFGNLHDSSFMDIWRGPAYRRLKSSYATQPLCRGCNMRKPEEVRR